MSTQRKKREDASGPSEKAVGAYLRANPAFFERHPDVLDALRLPHATGGGTVSLVERQMERLRAHNVQLERQLSELVAIARANEALVDKIHRLALRLLQAEALGSQLEIVASELRERFAVEHSLLVLLDRPELPDGSEESDFLRVAAADDSALEPFATLFESGQPRCGRLLEAQRRFLFGEHAEAIGSAALLPLGGAVRPRGLLALGSSDAHQFNPGNGTELLQRIGEMVTAVLAANESR